MATNMMVVGTERELNFAERLQLTSRREFLSTVALTAGAMPLFAQDKSINPPQYSAKVMRPANVHDIAEVARRTVDPTTFDYIEGGTEDELTLRHNVEAFQRVALRRRVMVDVSEIDTSLEYLGQQLQAPILLCPTTKNAVIPNGDRVSAQAAHATNTLSLIHI